MIAGESSGDMYGSYLAKLLYTVYPNIKISGWGGDLMAASKVNLVKHISQLSFMGFTEVIKHSFQIRKHFIECKDQIKAFGPDIVVFIDYSGFNLRLAPWVKVQGIRTVQYIAPKVWAWNKGRLKQLKRYIDCLICIFPFEVDYFKNQGLHAHYLGNPLVNRISTFQSRGSVNKNDLIALFPGSRKQEIQRTLSIMLEFAQILPNTQFLLGGLSVIGKDFYNNILNRAPTDNISVSYDCSYEILNQCKYAITTSGTITLEACLFGVPQIVVYKTHRLTYELGKRLIKIPYISLPNILMGRPVVKELIQHKVNANNLGTELQNLEQNSEKIKTDYQSIAKMLSYKVEEEKIAQLILGNKKKAT